MIIRYVAQSLKVVNSSSLVQDQQVGLTYSATGKTNTFPIRHVTAAQTNGNRLKMPSLQEPESSVCEPRKTKYRAISILSVCFCFPFYHADICARGLSGICCPINVDFRKHQLLLWTLVKGRRYLLSCSLNVFKTEERCRWTFDSRCPSLSNCSYGIVWVVTLFNLVHVYFTSPSHNCYATVAPINVIGGRNSTWKWQSRLGRVLSKTEVGLHSVNG